jgi:hypothetical protein
MLIHSFNIKCCLSDLWIWTWSQWMKCFYKFTILRWSLIHCL